VLARHLPELVECGDAVLPLLPTACKAALLAAARARGLLCDAALALLADDGMEVLDLSATEAVTEAAARAALRACPRLRRVDLSGRDTAAGTLRTLAASCPKLELLRLGAPPRGAAQGADALGLALKQLLPALSKNLHAQAESWDAAAESDDGGGGGPARLMRLRCVRWPEMPHSLRRYCATHTPAVLINPTDQEARRRRLPPAFGPAAQLDAADLAAVAGAEAWRGSGDAEQEGGGAAAPVLHIAERFRLAFAARDEREARARLKQARNLRQQRGREERKSSSGGLWAIRQWELEL
jgi:hypothetical protein